MERQWSVLKDRFSDAELTSTMSGQKAKVEGIIQALLQVAVADTDMGVRKSNMEHVQSMFAANLGKMEAFFAQAESMRVLRICMNDECMAVRNTAISLMGQLSVYNPACVNPTLRRHLHQVCPIPRAFACCLNPTYDLSITALQTYSLLSPTLL